MPDTQYIIGPMTWTVADDEISEDLSTVAEIVKTWAEACRRAVPATERGREIGEKFERAYAQFVELIRQNVTDDMEHAPAPVCIATRNHTTGTDFHAELARNQARARAEREREARLQREFDEYWEQIRERERQNGLHPM